MHRTTYHVEKMDCAAEERLVRMALDGVPGVERLGFDLPARRVVVVHTGDAAPVTAALSELGLGADPVGEEELLVEAHETQDTPLATATFFAGFLALLLLEMAL